MKPTNVVRGDTNVSATPRVFVSFHVPQTIFNRGERFLVTVRQDTDQSAAARAAARAAVRAVVSACVGV